MKPRLALVSDFDGTISDDDFFWFVADRYLDKQALEPWKKYINGELSHLEALNQIFAEIHIPENELLAFIDTIRVDKAFYKTVEICRKKEIPVYICSAGCDYYINRLIGKLIKDYNIQLITNHGVYNSDKGLEMIPPFDSPFYDKDVGISKAGVVEHLHKAGYEVIFAGDGPPDYAPACIANVVFAKKILLDKCLTANIKTKPFTNFDDVNAFLKEV